MTSSGPSTFVARSRTQSTSRYPPPAPLTSAHCPRDGPVGFSTGAPRGLLDRSPGATPTAAGLVRRPGAIAADGVERPPPGRAGERAGRADRLATRADRRRRSLWLLSGALLAFAALCVLGVLVDQGALAGIDGYAVRHLMPFESGPGTGATNLLEQSFAVQSGHLRFGEVIRIPASAQARALSSSRSPRMLWRRRRRALALLWLIGFAAAIAESRVSSSWRSRSRPCTRSNTERSAPRASFTRFRAATRLVPPSSPRSRRRSGLDSGRSSPRGSSR